MIFWALSSLPPSWSPKFFPPLEPKSMPPPRRTDFYPPPAANHRAQVWYRSQYTSSLPAPHSTYLVGDIVRGEEELRPLGLIIVLPDKSQPAKKKGQGNACICQVLTSQHHMFSMIQYSSHNKLPPDVLSVLIQGMLAARVRKWLTQPPAAISNQVPYLKTPSLHTFRNCLPISWVWWRAGRGGTSRWGWTPGSAGCRRTARKRRGSLFRPRPTGDTDPLW